MCLCNIWVAVKQVAENTLSEIECGVQNNLKGANGNGIGNNNVGVSTAPQPHQCLN